MAVSVEFRRAMNHALTLMLAAVFMALTWCFFRLPDGNLLMVAFAFLSASVLYDVKGWANRLKLVVVMAVYAATLQFLIGICWQSKFLLVILPALFSFITLRTLDNRCSACTVIIIGYLGFFAQGGFLPSINRAFGILVAIGAVMLSTSLISFVHKQGDYIPTFGKPFTMPESFRIFFILLFGTFLSNVLALAQGAWIMLTAVFIYLAVNETHDHIYYSQRRVYGVPLGVFLGALYMACLTYFNYRFVYLIPAIGALGFFFLYYYDDYFFFTVMFMFAFSIYSDWATGDMNRFHITELLLARSLATAIGLALVILFELFFLPENRFQKGKILCSDS